MLAFQVGLRQLGDRGSAAIAGEGLPLVLLQDELEKLADWCALPNSRKVVSRLELLQSPGEAHYELGGAPLSPEMFTMIDEPLTEDSGGCGFIPEQVLELLQGTAFRRLPGNFLAARRQPQQK